MKAPYSYSVVANDPNGDDVKCVFDWGDETTSETDYVTSGTTVESSHAWDKAGEYEVKVKVIDREGSVSEWSEPLMVNVTEPHDNTPPQISISYPTDSAYVSATVIWINGTVTEPNPGILEPSINDTRFALASWDSSSGFFAFKNITVIPAGVVAAAVNFTDSAGNTGSATVNFIYSQALGAWRVIGTLPVPLMSFAIGFYNNRVYIIGGNNGTHGPFASVYYASILADGSIGEWYSTTPLPEGRAWSSQQEAVVYNNRIYVIGGRGPYPPQRIERNTVWFANINADGSLGKWISTTSLPDCVNSHITTIWNGRIYVIGGWTGYSWLNKVYYSNINADGSISSWSSTTSLPQPRGHDQAGMAYNGVLYELGGQYYSGSFKLHNTVYYAAVNNDGTVSGWTATSLLPHELGGHTVSILGGKMYVIGGYYIGSTVYLNEVYSAQIQSIGSLGSWSQEPSLPEKRTRHSSLAHDSRIYVFGGQDENGESVDTIYCLGFVETQNSPPTAPYITSPNGGETWSGRHNITWTSSTDPDGDTVTCQLQYSSDDGNSWHNLVSGISEIYYEWNTTIFADGGKYLIRVRAYDGLIYSSWDQSYETFSIDNTPPIISITYPFNGALVATPLWINGSIVETNKGTAEPIISDSGFSLRYWNSTSGDFGFVRTLSWTDGPKTITITFTDMAGNTGSADTSFTLDCTAPVVAITYPLEGEGVARTTLWINGTVTELSVDSLEPSINDTRFSLVYWNSSSRALAFANNTQIPIGNVSVTVSFTDIFGRTGSDTVTFTIFPVAQGTPPSASFTYSPAYPITNYTIMFDASSSYDSDGEIIAYNWNFGDGSTCSGKIASHMYKNLGVYMVVLSVEDNSSNLSEASLEITVWAAKVSVGCCQLGQGGWKLVPIWVYGSNIGAYDFNITFNPNVVNLTGVVGGDAPFNSPTYSINSQGYIRTNQFTAATEGPSGNIIVAYLNVTAVGNPGECCKLGIDALSLVDASTGEEFTPRMETDGNVTVASFEVTVSLDIKISEEGYVVLEASFTSFKTLTGGLRAYVFRMLVSEDIIVISVLGGQSPFNATPNVDKTAAQIITDWQIAETEGPQMTNLIIMRLKLRLNSKAGIECSIEPVNLKVVDIATKTEQEPAVNGQRISFVRGDVNKDKRVTIADAMFIAQYLAGNRLASDLNLLNAASVKQDGSDGDKVSIADAMFIAQYLAGLRDEYFNL